MKRIFILFILLYSLLVSIVSAEPLDALTMADELGQSQSLENMKIGVYAIPEKVINSYFSTIAANHPKVKDASLSILENNKIRLSANVADVGNLRLTCVVKDFHFDKDKSSLKLKIEKKEIVGSPIASWLVNQMSVGFITSIYGNPLQEANLNSKVNGNQIEIDLEPFAASLFKSGIGKNMGSLLEISKVTTGNGVLYLHTNVSIGLLSGAN